MTLFVYALSRPIQWRVSQFGNVISLYFYSMKKGGSVKKMYVARNK